MPTINEVFEIIARDEQLAQGLFDTIDELKDREQQQIIEILERYLTTELVDEDGFIKPGALTGEQLDAFEDDLIGYFDYDNLDPFLDDVLNTFNTRLSTIDDLMVDLELEGGILGEDVFELPLVADEIDRVGEAMVEARNGDGEDWEGSLSRIRSQFADYRYNREQGRSVKMEELKETLRKDAHVLPNYTNSIASTALARMDRSLRRTQSLSAGLEYGRYVGPLDDLTRPFCEEHLDEVREWEEWDNMENDMTIELYKSPVSKVGGGINCRHRIIPWDISWSEGMGKVDVRERLIAAYRRIAA